MAFQESWHTNFVRTVFSKAISTAAVVATAECHPQQVVSYAVTRGADCD